MSDLALNQWTDVVILGPEPDMETGQDSDDGMAEFVTETLACIPVESGDEGTQSFAELDREAAEKLTLKWRNLHRDERESLAFIEQEIAAKSAELDALMDRKAAIQQPFNRRRDWFLMEHSPRLERFARRAIGDGKTRSLKLAYGTLSLVKKPASIAVVDEAAALEWAAENAPDAVRRTLQKTPLNKWFKSSGEVPAGCEVTPESDTFSMKVEG